ncbi:hypothetical protein [Priestia megaterium]|nr:hypothetical protein [Priestia megaterium]
MFKNKEDLKLIIESFKANEKEELEAIKAEITNPVGFFDYIKKTSN